MDQKEAKKQAARLKRCEALETEIERLRTIRDALMKISGNASDEHRRQKRLAKRRRRVKRPPVKCGSSGLQRDSLVWFWLSRRR